MPSYLICASPRTGSNMLATALRNTSVAGCPREYFNINTMNAPFMLRLLGRTLGAPPDLAGRLEDIIHAGTGDNGMFGATVHAASLRHLLAALAARYELPSTIEGLETLFPDLRYIWLRRENKIAQAISRYLARTTGRYQEPDREGAPAAPRIDVPFDPSEFSRFEGLNQQEETFWRAFLADRAAVTLVLSYEELDAAYETTLAKTLAFLGLDPAIANIPRPAFRRQADELSRDWERRYRALKAERG